MKKRDSVLIAVLLVCVCALFKGIVNSDLTNRNNIFGDTKNNFTPGLSGVSEMFTLPGGVLSDRGIAISDEEGAKLNELFITNGIKSSSGSYTGTKVNPRDWSQYSSENAKSNMTKSEAAFYDRLYNACEMYMNAPSRSNAIYNSNTYFISTPVLYFDLGLSMNAAKNVLYWFRCNNPQFYFIEGTAMYSTTTMYVSVYDFVMNLPDQGAVTNAMFDKLDSWIAECCDDEVTDWDKITAANEKICRNITYSSAVKAGDMSAAGGKNQSMYSVLMSEDTVCTGYAYTFCAMANAMGIETYTMTSHNHAWNAARFSDGYFYFVDVCWNDSSNAPYSEDYVGVGTVYMAKHDTSDESHSNYADYVKKFAPPIAAGDYSGSDKKGASSDSTSSSKPSAGSSKPSESSGRPPVSNAGIFSMKPESGGSVTVAINNSNSVTINGSATVTISSSAIIQYSNGTYMGTISNGMRNGAGIYVFNNGDSISCYWKDDMPCGDGTYFCANGKKIGGNWDGYEIVGKARIDYERGSYTYMAYEGSVKNGRADGEGRRSTVYNDGSFMNEVGEFRNADETLHNGTITIYNADKSVRSTKTIVNGEEV